jgi:cytochrome oxidase Cu insertion factor (SCO1/SenC/PrrC family)
MRYTLLTVVAVSLLEAACSERSAAASAFNASDISTVDSGRDFQLTDYHGRQRRLAQLVQLPEGLLT